MPIERGALLAHDLLTMNDFGTNRSFEAGDGGQQDGPASDSKSGEASQDAGVDAAKDAQDGDAGTDAGSWSPDCPATLPALKGACKTEGFPLPLFGRGQVRVKRAARCTLT